MSTLWFTRKLLIRTLILVTVAWVLFAVAPCVPAQAETEYRATLLEREGNYLKIKLEEREKKDEGGWTNWEEIDVKEGHLDGSFIKPRFAPLEDPSPASGGGPGGGGSWDVDLSSPELTGPQVGVPELDVPQVTLDLASPDWTLPNWDNQPGQPGAGGLPGAGPSDWTPPDWGKQPWQTEFGTVDGGTPGAGYPGWRMPDGGIPDGGVQGTGLPGATPPGNPNFGHRLLTAGKAAWDDLRTGLDAFRQGALGLAERAWNATDPVRDWLNDKWQSGWQFVKSGECWQFVKSHALAGLKGLGIGLGVAVVLVLVLIFGFEIALGAALTIGFSALVGGLLYGLTAGDAFDWKAAAVWSLLSAIPLTKAFSWGRSGLRGIFAPARSALRWFGATRPGRWLASVGAGPWAYAKYLFSRVWIKLTAWARRLGGSRLGTWITPEVRKAWKGLGRGDVRPLKNLLDLTWKNCLNHPLVENIHRVVGQGRVARGLKWVGARLKGIKTVIGGPSAWVKEGLNKFEKWLPQGTRVREAVANPLKWNALREGGELAQKLWRRMGGQPDSLPETPAGEATTVTDAVYKEK